MSLEFTIDGQKDLAQAKALCLVGATESGLYTPTPTGLMYLPLLTAFNHFNNEVFNSRLLDCLLTLRANKKNTKGYYHAKRFAALEDPTVFTDEIAMNSAYFTKRDLRDTASTLVHEMCHHDEEHSGSPPRKGYHSKWWAAKMREVGLQPTNTGKVGGKETGDRMDHYIVDGGPFALSFERLVATGWQLGWGDAATVAGAGGAEGEGAVKSPKRTREPFKCESCGMTAQSRASAELVCFSCAIAARPDLADFLRRFKFRLIEHGGAKPAIACSDVSARPALPAWIEARLASAPHYSDRRSLAQIHTELFSPISPRTFEEWPLTWQLANGRAVTNTRDAITLAWQRLQDAPQYRGGRKKTAEVS
jgi:hypothetical protein